MAKIERGMSRWQTATRAMARSPQIVRCALTFANWRDITSIYAGAEMSGEFAARGRAGFSLLLRHPTDVQTVWIVFCGGEYYVPRGAGTVLDLGANIGAFSVYASCCRGAKRIYALEPVSLTFALLQSNILANGLSNITAVPKGIGGVPGQRTIHLGITSQHASLIHRGDPRYESGYMEKVEIITLEQLFDELGIDQVDMVKMDCEGGEVEAILAASDATLRRIRNLSLEYHYPAALSNDAEFFGRLEKAGFRCTHRSRIGRLAQFVRV